MNTSDHLCRQAMSILRKRQGAARVDAHDIAFLKSHVASCHSCLADSAVIRGMLSLKESDRFDDLTVRRTADAVLRRKSDTEREEDEVTLLIGRCQFAIPVAAAAAAAAVLVLGLYLIFSPSSANPPPQTGVNASAKAEDRPIRTESPNRGHRASKPKAVPMPASKPLPSIKTVAWARPVMLPAGIRMLVQPASEVSIRRSDQSAITVMLDHGELLASVDPNREGPPFSVETRRGQVTVKGTVFTVTTDGIDDRVAVLRGRVTVTGVDGDEHLVVAGERFFLSDHRRQLLVEETQVAMAQDAARLKTVDELRGDYVDWRGPYYGPLKGPASVERHDAAMHLTTGPDSKETRQPSHPASPAIREMLLDVRRFRIAKQWQQAAETYQRIIENYPASEEARAALVALGDVQLNKLNRPEAALSLFDRYIHLNSTTVMEEALMGKAAALRRLGRMSEERAVLERFVARFPKSVHANVARNRLATLKRIHSSGGS